MEIFIQAKFEDYNSGGASQKAVRTVPPIRSQGTVMWVFWDRGLYIKWWQFTQYRCKWYCGPL